MAVFPGRYSYLGEKKYLQHLLALSGDNLRKHVKSSACPLLGFANSSKKPRCPVPSDTVRFHRTQSGSIGRPSLEEEAPDVCVFLPHPRPNLPREGEGTLKFHSTGNSP